MSKCCGSSCLCTLQAADDVEGNDSITITGTGTQQDPFLVSFQGMSANNSSTIDLDLSYTGGSLGLGYVLSASFAASSQLDDLGDVNAPGPTNGFVLGWDSATSKWTPRAPTTAASGSVVTDTSLTGDGSGGSPLAVSQDPDRFTDTFATGVGLSDAGINSLVRHFVDAAARTAAAPAPVLNSLSMLDDGPGMIDYWDGTDWQPLIRVAGISAPTEYLALSGPYDGRPMQVLTKLLSDSTGLAGELVLLDSTDLAGYAGVLAVSVQPTGSLVPWFFMLNDAPTTQVDGVAFAGDGTGELVSSSVTGLVTAFLY